jgi:hypothetical protein
VHRSVPCRLDANTATRSPSSTMSRAKPERRVVETRRGRSASTMCSAPLEIMYTYRPSVFTMSGSSTPSTCTLVFEVTFAVATEPLPCPMAPYEP